MRNQMKKNYRYFIQNFDRNSVIIRQMKREVQKDKKTEEKMRRKIKRAV